MEPVKDLVVGNAFALGEFTTGDFDVRFKFGNLIATRSRMRSTKILKTCNPDIFIFVKTCRNQLLQIANS